MLLEKWTGNSCCFSSALAPAAAHNWNNELVFCLISRCWRIILKYLFCNIFELTEKLRIPPTNLCCTVTQIFTRIYPGCLLLHPAVPVPLFSNLLSSWRYDVLQALLHVLEIGAFLPPNSVSLEVTFAVPLTDSDLTSLGPCRKRSCTGLLALQSHAGRGLGWAPWCFLCEQTEALPCR